MSSSMLVDIHILHTACRILFIGCLILAPSTVSSSCSQIAFSRQLLVTFEGRPGNVTDSMVELLQLSFLQAYNNVSTCGFGNFREITSVNVTRDVVRSFGFSFNNQSASYFVTQNFTWFVDIQGFCRGCDVRTFQLFDSDPFDPHPFDPTPSPAFSSSAAPSQTTANPTASPTPIACNCPAPQNTTFLQALNSRFLLPNTIDKVLGITLLFKEDSCSSAEGQFQEFFDINFIGVNNSISAVDRATQEQLLLQSIPEAYNNLNALNTAGVCDDAFRTYTNIRFVRPGDLLSQPPSVPPSQPPSVSPSRPPSVSPSQPPSVSPSQPPNVSPSRSPNGTPSRLSSDTPSLSPTSDVPGFPLPSDVPSLSPSINPSVAPGFGISSVGPSSTINGGSRLLGSSQQRQLLSRRPTRQPTARPTRAPAPTTVVIGGNCNGPCPPGKSSVGRDGLRRRALLSMKWSEKQEEDEGMPNPSQVPVVPTIESNHYFVAHHHQSYSSTSTTDDERERIDSYHQRRLPVVNGKCYCQANTVVRRVPLQSEVIRAYNDRLQVIGPNGAGLITIVSGIADVVQVTPP